MMLTYQLDSQQTASLIKLTCSLTFKLVKKMHSGFLLKQQEYRCVWCHPCNGLPIKIGVEMPKQTSAPLYFVQPDSCFCRAAAGTKAWTE